MRSRIVAVLTAVAVLGLAAAPALARSRFTDRVVPFRSIAGVPLKATPAQIRARFGKPDAVFREDHRVSGYQYNNSTQMQIDFDIQDRHDRAMLISANGTRLRTIDGIHYGTTVKTLRHRLRANKTLKCQKGLGCSIDRGNASEPGSSVTAFATDNGKVTGFSVSYMFNDD